jgi:hypothetical protein
VSPLHGGMSDRLLRPAMSLLKAEGGYVWANALWLAPGKDGSANVEELVWLVTYVLMVSPLGTSPEPLTMAWKPAGGGLRRAGRERPLRIVEGGPSPRADGVESDGSRSSCNAAGHDE